MLTEMELKIPDAGTGSLYTFVGLIYTPNLAVLSAGMFPEI